MRGRPMRFQKTLMVGILLLALVAVSYAGDSASRISLDVKEFTLENGMLFLVVERPSTPKWLAGLRSAPVPHSKTRVGQVSPICLNT